MFTLTTRRRRAENARVTAFLHAIELSARYTVDPDWQLQQLEDEPAPAIPLQRTDTVQFPRIVLTAGARL